MNQVLMEEIKVKDAIIRTNEEINNLSKNNEGVEHINPDGQQDESNKNKQRVTKCSKCDWTSTNHSQLPGHMIKHNVGQYVCPNCNLPHKTKKDMDDHIKTVHNAEEGVNRLACQSCDKAFPSQHSLKQHINSKHMSEKDLLAEHPQRARMKNAESLKIACTQCDKNFATGKEIDDHMTEHDGSNHTEQDLTKFGYDKVCKYFRNGFCLKGDECPFKHIQIQPNVAPQCGRGQGCIFLQQNRCFYFHPVVGVQQQRIKRNPQMNVECRYKDQCWNIDDCSFSHQAQGFRHTQRSSRPPQGSWRKNAWMNY